MITFDDLMKRKNGCLQMQRVYSDSVNIYNIPLGMIRG